MVQLFYLIKHVGMFRNYYACFACPFDVIFHLRHAVFRLSGRIPWACVMERAARQGRKQEGAMTIVWTVCAFLSGSFMFSYWLGLIAKKNLKTVGDGNPGALNLWKAAGYKLGIVGIILDFYKRIPYPSIGIRE